MRRFRVGVSVFASVIMLNAFGIYNWVLADETEIMELSETIPDDYNGEMEENLYVSGKVFHFDNTNHYDYSTAED